jgi:hypothetical protein
VGPMALVLGADILNNIIEIFLPERIIYESVFDDFYQFGDLC